MEFNKLLLGLVLVVLFSGFAFATITSINLISPGNNTWVNSSQPTFDFNATSDINSTFSCTLYVNDTPYGTNTSVINGTLTQIIANATISDGTYGWYLNCTDINGTNESNIYIVGIDTLSPTISIFSNVQNDTWTNLTSPVVNATASDSGSGVKEMYYCAATAKCTPTNNYTPGTAIYISSEGTWYVTFKAVDNVGNSNEDTFIVKHDTTPPTISISTPSNNSYINSSTVTINWSGYDSLSALAYYEISNDSVNWVNVGLNTSQTYSYSDGSHTFYVKAVDNAGNSNVTNVLFTVDTIAPTIAISSNAPNDTWVNHNINVSATANDTNGVNMYYCESTSGVCDPTIDYTQDSNITITSDGTTYVVFKAVDPAGNVNETTYVAKIDTINPSLVYSTTTSDGNSYTNNTWTNYNVTLQINATDDRSGIKSIYVNDSGTVNVYNTPNIDVNFSTEGVHNVTFWTEDNAGNLGSSHYLIIKIDKTSPTSSSPYATTGVTSLPGYTNGTWTSYNITYHLNGISDALSGVNYTELIINGNPVGKFYGSSLTYAFTKSGVYNVTYYIVDNAGNIRYSTPGDELTIKIDKIAPTLNVILPINNSYLNSSNVVFNITSFDTLSGVNDLRVTYSNGTVVGAVTSSNELYFTKAFSDGQYTLYIESTDNVVEGSPNENSTMISFTVDTIPPQVNATMVQSNGIDYVNNTWTNKNVNVTLSVNDANFAYVLYSVNGTSKNTTNTTIKIQVTSNGITPITYSAFDKAGNVKKGTLVIKIDKINPQVIPYPHIVQSVKTLNTTFLTKVYDTISGIDSKRVYLYLSNYNDSDYSIPVPMNYSSGMASAIIPVGNISNQFFGPGTHYMKVCALDNAGNLNCTVSSAPIYIKIVSIDSLKELLAKEGINFSVFNSTTGANITAPAISPTEYKYNYMFEKNGVNITLYNVTITSTELLKMSATNISYNPSDLVNKFSSMKNITAVWASFPWANATDYTYGKVVFNGLYNGLSYCPTQDNCIQINPCNATINSTNYNTVIPKDGACYTYNYTNNMTTVYVDHFSGVVVGSKPVVVHASCSSSYTYVGATLTCTCSADSNLPIVSLNYTKIIRPQAPGTYTFTCYAKDKAGNTGVGTFGYTVYSPIMGGGKSNVNTNNTKNVTEVTFNITNMTSSVRLNTSVMNAITLHLKSNPSGARIGYSEVSNVNISLPTNVVYKVVEFSLYNITDKEINSVVFNFKVSKLWIDNLGLSPNEIALFRYSNNTWTKLNTTLVYEDSNYVYYNATSPGLSYYAIAAVNSTNNTQNNTVVTHHENGTLTISQNNENPLLGVALLILSIALSIGYAVYLVKLNKRRSANVKRKNRRK